MIWLVSSWTLAQNKILGLNDITVLLPLPSAKEFSELLPTEKLIPKKAYSLLPILFPVIDQDNAYEHNLKVIAMRFDPCFFEGTGPMKCTPQIRLVWQPLIIVGEQTNTLDTAIHSFYSFNTTEWQNILAELKSISNADPSLALQAHPTLLAEGYHGPYWQNLKTLVLKYCNEKSLNRLTVMTNRMDRVWGFQGLDKKTDNTTGWTQIRIPTLTIPDRPDALVVNQAFFLDPDSMQNLREFKGGISLIDKKSTSWFRMSSDSLKFKETFKQEDLENLIQRAYAIENPNLHNPGTVDCVSCHLAQVMRLWTEDNFPNQKFNELFKTDIYTSTKPTSNLSIEPYQFNRARNLGYFNRDLAISQRVINETAQILTGLK